MLSSMNHEILLALYSLATSSALASGIVIFFAEWFPFLIVASIVLYKFLTTEKEGEILRVLVRTAIPSLIVWVIVAFIKNIFPSPRPFADDLGITPLISVADSFGAFPSAHAAIFGSLAGTMFANHVRVGKWYLLGAIAIAIARVAAGVHWPGDVLAGILFGLLLGFGITKIIFAEKKSLTVQAKNI